MHDRGTTRPDIRELDDIPDEFKEYLKKQLQEATENEPYKLFTGTPRTSPSILQQEFEKSSRKPQ